MSELLRWFEKRRETKALKMIQRHLAITMTIVEDLEKAIKAAVRNDREEMKKCVIRVANGEKEADKLRRKVMDELSRGTLPPIDREDLMHLTKRVDMVADWSRESTRLLDAVPMDKVSDNLKKSGVKMVEGIRECTIALRKCINSIMTEPQAALQAADEVERKEENVDELHGKARRLLVKERQIEPGVVVLLHELFESLEMIADACENACDQIRVIIVRR